MTNRAADDGVGDTTSFIVLPRCSASKNTFVAIVAVVVNDNNNNDDGGVPPSTLPEAAAAAVVGVVVVVIRILDGHQPGRG